MRYFLEDIFLTANYATEHLAMKRLHIAGLSGGGWSTTFAAAMDPRTPRTDRASPLLAEAAAG